MYSLPFVLLYFLYLLYFYFLTYITNYLFISYSIYYLPLFVSFSFAVFIIYWILFSYVLLLIFQIVVLIDFVPLCTNNIHSLTPAIRPLLPFLSLPKPRLLSSCLYVTVWRETQDRVTMYSG